MRDNLFRFFTVGAILLSSSIVIFLLIQMAGNANYEWGDSASDREYFYRAAPDTVVKIDKVAWHSDGLFSNYSTVLFHTDNATMEKVVKHYHYNLASEPGTADTQFMSDDSITHAGGGRYRNIRSTPARIYTASGPESFTTRIIYWDPKTETGCLHLIQSD